LRRLVALAVAVLLGAPVVAHAAESDCPSAVRAVRGSNPSYATVASHLKAAATAHGVPVQVLKAIAFKESGWRPFHSDGRPKISTDSVCGVGLMQVTLGSRTDGVKLASDVAYNAAEGAKILKQKWLDGLDQDHPQPTGYDPDDPDVLENWYAAICRYNGCSFTAGGDAAYASPVARLVRDPFHEGVPSAIVAHWPPAGFTRPADADATYTFPGGFQAQHDPVQQFVFYDGATGAVTKTVPAPTHRASTAFPTYGVARGPGGPGVSCGGCQWWLPYEGYGLAGWAHVTNSVTGAGSSGVHVTWAAPRAGYSDVRVWVPSLGAGVTLGKATYRLGATTVTVDQEQSKGTWVYLGRSNASSVVLGDGSDAAGKKIVADGMRFSAVTALSITPSAPVVSYGRSSALTLRLSQVGGTGISGRQVTLLKRKVGVLEWTTVGTYVTGADGKVTVNATPAANTYYRVLNSSDGDLVAATPATTRVDVKPAVRATLSKTTVTRGTAVKVSVTVTPAHPGHKVVLQRYYSSGWHDALSATLSGTSTASWTFSKGAGTHKYRVYKAADSDHAASWSATLTLTVT
jgi:hypothetical protein